MDKTITVNMTQEEFDTQLSELKNLNPDGIPITYTVTSDAAGQILTRIVQCHLFISDAKQLRAGVFAYCDVYAQGDEVKEIILP